MDSGCSALNRRRVKPNHEGRMGTAISADAATWLPSVGLLLAATDVQRGASMVGRRRGAEIISKECYTPQVMDPEC